MARGWRRREFLDQTWATLLTGACLVPDSQSYPREMNYSFALEPGATLWGYVGFLGEQLVEIIIAGRHTTSLQGRFDGKRLQEFTYVNRDRGQPERVSLTARRVGDDDLLPMTGFQSLGSGNPMVGFGYRPLPQTPSTRQGVYAFDAVLMSFSVFG